MLGLRATCRKEWILPGSPCTPVLGRVPALYTRKNGKTESAQVLHAGFGVVPPEDEEYEPMPHGTRVESITRFDERML